MRGGRKSERGQNCDTFHDVISPGCRLTELFNDPGAFPSARLICSCAVANNFMLRCTLVKPRPLAMP
jgi:hypothetical protein